MTVNIATGSIYLIWTMLSFLLWRKRRDKDLLWFIWLGAIGLVAEVADFLLRYVFYAPSSLLFYGGLFLFCFGVIAILILVWIGFRMLMKRKNSKQP